MCSASARTLPCTRVPKRCWRPAPPRPSPRWTGCRDCSRSKAAAEALAGGCSTWYRMFTDPATGTPIDGRSKSYYIPADVRAPLIGKWQSCSTPRCTRRAETSEIDHIIPFDLDVAVESPPQDTQHQAEDAWQVHSCARSQDPNALAGTLDALQTAETAESAEAVGSVLRFSSESCVEATG